MKESYITNAEGRLDNYQLTCEKWRRIFLEMDQKELAERFGLEQDEEAFYIVYYHQKYRLDKKNGMIVLNDDPERSLSFNTVMSIYNLFYYSKPYAQVRGEFVPFRQVKRAAPFDPAFKKTVIDVLAESFEGRADLLEKACISMGGTPVRQGDVGYILKAFDWMPVMVVFWDGDDEFKAQANILFDADITDFLHEETVVCIGADLVKRLCEEAGLGSARDLMGDGY